MKTDHLTSLLDYLSEHCIHSDYKEREELCYKALMYEKVERLPLICSYPFPEGISPFSPCIMGETYDNPSNMLYNELLSAFDQSIAYNHLLNDDLPWTIRANFGTVLVSSMAQGNVEFFEHIPPWVRPFEDKDSYLSLLDQPISAGIHTSTIQKVIETYEFFHSALEPYHELRERIHVVLPDTQGPLDTCEQLRGSDFYIDLYEDPESCSRMLDHIAQMQIELVNTLLPYTTERGKPYTFQHGTMIIGEVLVRNDSSTLISSSMYTEHIAPYDEMVLKAVGGGGIHSCGKVEHLIDAYLEHQSLRCIDLGQPELNNVDALYAKVSQNKIPLVRVTVPQKELVDASVLDRFATGVSLIYRASSLKDAQKTMESYRNASEKRGNL